MSLRQRFPLQNSHSIYCIADLVARQLLGAIPVPVWSFIFGNELRSLVFEADFKLIVYLHALAIDMCYQIFFTDNQAVFVLSYIFQASSFRKTDCFFMSNKRSMKAGKGKFKGILWLILLTTQIKSISGNVRTSINKKQYLPRRFCTNLKSTPSTVHNTSYNMFARFARNQPKICNELTEIDRPLQRTTGCSNFIFDTSIFKQILMTCFENYKQQLY